MRSTTFEAHDDCFTLARLPDEPTRAAAHCKSVIVAQGADVSRSCPALVRSLTGHLTSDLRKCVYAYLHCAPLAHSTVNIPH